MIYINIYIYKCLFILRIYVAFCDNLFINLAIVKKLSQNLVEYIPT